MDRVLGRNRDDALEGEFLFFGWTSEKGLSAWPGLATTDAAGRFILHGVGKNLRVVLAVDDAEVRLTEDRDRY